MQIPRDRRGNQKVSLPVPKPDEPGPADDGEPADEFPDPALDDADDPSVGGSPAPPPFEPHLHPVSRPSTRQRIARDPDHRLLRRVGKNDRAPFPGDPEPPLPPRAGRDVHLAVRRPGSPPRRATLLPGATPAGFPPPAPGGQEGGLLQRRPEMAALSLPDPGGPVPIPQRGKRRGKLLRMLPEPFRPETTVSHAPPLSFIRLPAHDRTPPRPRPPIPEVRTVLPARFSRLPGNHSLL